ncbi:hypothetical protein [Candidatus Albibeggiatoa sp. nov. NOAA]|uniref:hypothetical protein n=1 Tax=Candidatus Albibeggiatoa sp. nov. NOAA TaxID=3162724 RepID=UPI0032FDCEDB|nr:hypothetical protein [Thiotrichaceae bacterium]
MVLQRKSKLHEMEEQFLRAFIMPKYYDRAYHELCSEDVNKRGNFFGKLERDHILKKNCKIDIPHLTKEQQFPTIQSMLISHGAKQDRAYISSDTDSGTEQNICFLDDGLKECLSGIFLTVVLICDNVAFVQLERETGSPPRFLLAKR